MPSHPSDLRARSVRGGFWAAAGAIATSLAGLTSFLVLSRLLGPEAYGLIAMVEAALALGQRLLSSGLSEPLIQIPHIHEDHSHTLFWTLQVLGLLMTAAMIAVSGPVGVWFEEPRLPPLLIGSAVALYLQACGLVSGALLARRFAFREGAQAGVVAELTGGVLAIVLALLGYGVWALVFQRVAAAGSGAVVLIVKAAWRPRLRFSLRALQEVWHYSASRGLEGLLLYCDQQAPRILLGRVVGATELGYFVFARRIVENSVNLLNGPIRATALSAFAVIQHDTDRVRRTYAEGTVLSAAAVLPAIAGIALVAPYLVQLLVGPDWQPSILLLQLLVFASVRATFHVWNGALLRGLGRPQYLLVSSLVRTLSILILMGVLLPWGAPGVCIATILGALLSWPIAMQFVRNASGMSVADQLQPAVAPVLSTLLMSAAVLALQSLLDPSLSAAPMLAISAAAGVLVYAASMAVIGRPALASLWRNLKTLRPAAPSPTDAD